MRPLTLFFTMTLTCSLFASSVQLSNVVLYQPNAVLHVRLGNVTSLATYIKSVRTICESSFQTEDAEALDIVIVMKPNGKSRVWFISTLLKMPDRSKVKQAIEAVAVPSVKGGPIVFALCYNLNGVARMKTADGTIQPPIPDEWKAKTKDIKGPLVMPDGFIPLVWPDEEKT